MKKLIVLLTVLVLAMSASAKSLRDMWVTMPDSLLPTLNANLRLELVELRDMGVKAEVKNLLGSDCVIDTLTTDYLQLTSSKAAFVQMKMLPRNGKDSILCVVKTFAAPEKESNLRFYQQDWTELDKAQLLAEGELEDVSKWLAAKSDTMNVDHYRELIEPRMYFAELSLQDDTIVFQLSLPLVSEEEKMKLNAIIMQRKLKWNGERFNEI